MKKPFFDFFVFFECENSIDKYDSIVFRCDTENTTIHPIYDVPKFMKKIADMARADGIEPVQIVFVPYLHIVREDDDGMPEIVFVRDVRNIKCLWAAAGHCPDDTDYMHLIQFEFSPVDESIPYDSEEEREQYINNYYTPDFFVSE